MKLLWTVSNWKRTGPVEPSLDLAVAFRELGHEVQVACGVPPATEEPESADAARARELDVVETSAQLHKHSAPWRDLRDARRLRAWIRRAQPDGLVATHRSGHRLLLRATGRDGPPVVRLWFGDGLEDVDPRDVQALRRSAGVLVFGDAPRRQLEELGVSSERIVRTGPPLGVDAIRAQVTDPQDLRRELGIEGDRFVFGIVARLQTHRRFEDLWGAAARLRIDRVPFHLVVVGRGTHAQTVGRDPVRELGLDDHVTFTGYLRGERYATTIAAFDAQLFLVPGSDPTCRALREGMALGVPSIAARRGLLPEIVDDGVTGLVIPTGVEPLADAMRRMGEAPEAARRLGAGARDRADRLFAAPRVAAALGELWQRVTA
ncbi:MAG: glycosyltransferase family 4 protein [Planctomycetota bacterium]|nr:glycosyltransferase family 4 protein [Planctomycetota bacterium]